MAPIRSTGSYIGGRGIYSPNGSSPAPAFEFGNALEFDGGNDYVTYSQLSITGKGVISFWYNDATTSQIEIFNLSSNASYFIGVVASLNKVYYKAGSSVHHFNFSGGITAGIWNHILISIDVSAVTVNAWINGVQSDNVDLTSSRAFYSDRWNLREGGYDDFTLDETGIKLGVTGTTANALALYNGGAGASFDTVFPSPNRHYKLNETAGTVAADSGSDGANGTLVNFTLPGAWVPHTPAVDADAAAFISAAAITGATQKSALNQLVLDLKGTGSTTNNSDIWDKFYALYPMCPIDGSTATLDGFKYNLKDPRDLDAAFRIDWLNTPTVAQSGVTGNGTTQYGNSHFNANTTAILNDHSFGFFGGISNNMMGATPTSNNPYNSFNGAVYWGCNSTFNSNGTLVSGFTLTQRTGAATSAVYNNSSTANATSTLASSSKPNFESFLLARNFNGAVSGHSTAEFNLFFYGKSFTTNEIQDFYDAITTYNTALGR